MQDELRVDHIKHRSKLIFNVQSTILSDADWSQPNPKLKIYWYFLNLFLQYFNKQNHTKTYPVIIYHQLTFLISWSMSDRLLDLLDQNSKNFDRIIRQVFKKASKKLKQGILLS